MAPVLFNNASSPKFVRSQKVLLMSAASVSNFEVFEAFQHRQVMDKLDCLFDHYHKKVQIAI